jgi:hypothetical protein
MDGKLAWDKSQPFVTIMGALKLDYCPVIRLITNRPPTMKR